MTLRRLIGALPGARPLYRNTFFLRYFHGKLLRSRAHSYAQDGEDQIIERLLGNVSWFIDVGAHGGISVSNTFYFALRGARGICFEPVRETYQKLASLYAFSQRVICRNFGISDRSGSAVIAAADFLSYLLESEDKEHTRVSQVAFLAAPRPQTVELRTFAEAIPAAFPPEVDLLSVDVEGHEWNVLTSIPWDRFRFRAIVVETHLVDPMTRQFKWKHRDLHGIEELLAAHGYHGAGQTAANTIYLARRAL